MSRPSRFRTLGGVLLAALLTAGAAQAKPPIWIVRDHDSELILFGSVHVLPQHMDWEPEALAKALARADDIWFEIPVDEATEAETGRLAVQSGMLAPDQSLLKMLGPKDAERIVKVAQGVGVSAAMLDRFQPWLAEIALAGGAYRKAGADADGGVEKTLSATVTPTAQRRAFETPAEQIAMLSGGPIAEQLASLRETVQEMEDKPDEFATLVKAWADGDVAALDREALAPLRQTSAALFRRLVLDRNARWAAILDQRLKGRGRTVVVVGVGHLIGPEGVPARLRALGYSVTGP